VGSFSGCFSTGCIFSECMSPEKSDERFATSFCLVPLSRGRHHPQALSHPLNVRRLTVGARHATLDRPCD